MGNRVYLNCLYVYNKIDQVSLEEVDRLANLPYSVVISCYMKLNLGKKTKITAYNCVEIKGLRCR